MTKKKSVAEQAGCVSETDGFLEVSRTYPNGDTEKKQERIRIRPFVTNPATVSVKLGATIPTAQYANVRMDVMMSCPCYVEEMVPVFHELRKIVETLCEQVVTEMKQEVPAPIPVADAGEGARLEDLI